jgi:aldehyde dehydrogenase (NAD+)
MSDQRDWDKELADIDKVIAKMPAQSQAPAKAGAGAPVAAPTSRQIAAPSGGKLAVFTTWLRVALGLALAVGITQWPYASACGLNLIVYLGAIGVVVLAGLWSSVSSWRRRMGVAHTLSLMVLLWGLILGAREILPRSGYAKHMAPTFKNLIGGDWFAPSTGRYLENRNPADTSDLIGRFPDSGVPDIERAVRAASKAFVRWRTVPAPARGDLLKRLGDLLTANKESLADSMTREMGKVLAETRGDVQEGIDTAYYAASEGRRLFGHTVPSELREKWAMSWRRPIGVCGLITPFNFPLAIPTWKMFPALACGNTVVLKPSEDVPHTSHRLVELALEAGFPPGVINLVHGRGEVAGKALVEHPEVRVLSFTGSTETGSAIGEIAGRMHKRLSLEMGGKNALIVMADADLDLALDGVLWGAFGTTGQRCTATSRLLLHRKVHDKFLTRLADRASQLKLGDGRKPGVEVGPLIHEASRDKVERYVEIGRKAGARLVTGGKRPKGSAAGKGWFFEPTIFAGVQPGDRLEQEEIFGPVLSVVRIESLDEAITVNNGVRYGLSSSLYTRDIQAAFRAMQDLDNGITYINAPTIGAEAHLPFGGVKQTGNGHREGGWQVYEFYSETKVGYVDYSGRLQKAQIDNYGKPE